MSAKTFGVDQRHLYTRTRTFYVYALATTNVRVHVVLVQSKLRCGLFWSRFVNSVYMQPLTNEASHGRYICP